MISAVSKDRFRRLRVLLNISKAQALPLAGGLLVIALVWIRVCMHLNYSYEIELEQGRRDVANLSVALAEQVSRLIEGADQVMRLVQADFAEDPDKFDFATWMKRSTSLKEAAVQIAIFDERGDLVASRNPNPDPNAARPNVSDRAYFRFLADHPEAGLYVDRTLLGRINARWAFQLARRLVRPDGTFAGVFLVALDPEYIARHFRALDVGERGSVALFGVDGYVRARSPAAPGMYEVNATKINTGAGVFEHLKRARTGTYQVQSAFDGTTRIFGYRTLEHLPLVVTVGKSRDEVLAPFEYERWRTLATASGITLVLLTFGVLLTRELERRRRSEVRYRMLAENTSDMIVEVDMNTTRRYVSPACRKLLGYEPHELIGTKPLDMVHPDDRPGVQAVITDLAEGHTSSALKRQRYQRKDGSYVWVEVSYQLFYDANGQPAGCTACTRDISEQQAQAEALQEAKEAAERASAAKTDFLAVMSHEIRTPLNAIIGFTDLLASSDQLSPDLQRYAELARSSGHALLTVVNDILDFSKIEAGAIELERQAFAPRALIDNCLSIVRTSASQKGLNLQATIDPALPPGLIGDEARLRQVLLNLLNNAIKFTKRGSVILRVQHEGSVADGERLRFSVIDTGIGIARDKQHRLFQRFSQVDGTIERDFGGTGLGLAICKQLIELMGGTIGVLSEEGLGATFRFSVTLPLGSVEKPVSPGKDAPAACRRGRLLLVEDNAINQELACTILEAVGHTVDVVSDGLAALQAVVQGNYDLVLMDVQMPGMDGITATRRIRQLGTPSATVPIIAMTANVLPDQVRAFSEAGMDDYVSKPFNRGKLYAAVEKWLSWRAGTDEFEVAELVTDPGLLDRSTYDEILALIGSTRLTRLLEVLLEDLNGSLSGAALTHEERARLRHEAHSLVSSAGMLGFAALATACHGLEACNEQRVAQEGSEVFQHQLGQVRELAVRTAEQVRRLLGRGGISESLVCEAA
ncbi:ATP-binding protein [Methylobacterium oxalidis]|uniref:ATP-binding protein n=1 Tax=Methylobacterium oxalidis TaxID=944322 RepID=UPI00331488C7